MRKFRKFLSGLLVVGLLLPNVMVGSVEAATKPDASSATVAAQSASVAAPSTTLAAQSASVAAPSTTLADASNDAQEPAYVPGEAIVCFKTGDVPASKPEKQVKQEMEASLEKERSIDDAEALIAIEDADTVVEAVEATGAEEVAGEAIDSVKAGDAAEAGDDSNAAEAGDDSNAAEAGDDSNAAEPGTDGTAANNAADPAMIILVHSDTLTTDELLAELRARDDVLYAEPNYVASATESGDYTEYQWGNQGGYGIGEDGWDTYIEDTPTPQVDTSQQVLAIIDSGVDYTHEDLKDVMWTDGLNYPTLKAMGGGRYGYNSAYKSYGGDIYDTKDPMDQFGHGTHCAGIMVAAWNKTGTSGVACGARLMAVKVANEEGNYPEDAIVRGFQYVLEAKKAGVNVVATNNSYSRFMMTLTNTVLVQEAGKLGIVCVYSAGNDNLDLALTNNTSAFTGQAPNALVIGASTIEGKKASFSNYSSRDVHVFAPGENIMSTVRMQTGRPDYSDATEVEDPIFGLNGETVNLSIKTAGDEKNVLHIASKDRTGSITV